MKNHDTVFAWFDWGDTYYTYSGRVAIRKACELLKIGRGDNVLAPSYHCGSEISAIMHSGCQIILYKIKKNTEIDLEDLKSRINQNTKAIYITHYFGFPQSNVLEIKNLCLDNDLYLIEDCALGLFSSFNGCKLGAFGDVSIFSFGKYFPGIRGGALVVNKPDCLRGPLSWRAPPPSSVLRLGARAIAATIFGGASVGLLSRVRKVLQLPSTNTDARVSSPTHPAMPLHYQFLDRDLDLRMEPINRVLVGNISVSEEIEKRRAAYEVCIEQFRGVKKVQVVQPTLSKGVVPLAFPVLAQNRGAVIDKLGQLGVSVTRWWEGYHPDFNLGEFPEARYLKSNLLPLPLKVLNLADVIDVVRPVKKVT
jgi:perosamine synthetase